MLRNVVLTNEHPVVFRTRNIQFLKLEPVLKGRSDELYSLVSDECELTFISAHTLRLSVTERPSVHCSISTHLNMCVCARVCI